MKFSDLKKIVDSKEGELKSSDRSTERIKNLEVILDIVKNINQTLIIDDVLRLVLKNAISITNSERGFIVLLNNVEQLEYKIGLDSEGNVLPETSFNVSTTVVRDVFSTGQSKFIEGAQSDTEHDPSKSILRLELQTILCSPFISEGKKIGVIYVDSKHLQKVKVREITDTFEILAGQASTAIKNAQLFDGQVAAYNALNEANTQLIQSERKALKSSIDSEIGQSLQGLVHLALLENESMMRTIEKNQKELPNAGTVDPILFDRLLLKSKVAIDSIRNIQKYAQVLLETAIMNLNKDSGDLTRTIQSVIKYISPMKAFQNIVFKTNFKTVPVCEYDSEQIQHLLVHLFTNAAEAKKDANILISSDSKEGKVFIEIKDDGPGMSDEQLKRAFDLPSSQKSGYGLFLCKSIIERHNGQIKIIDGRNGTTVLFWIPINN
jgi:signal transduction histidine kinase